jgi:hypothetical protein
MPDDYFHWRRATNAMDLLDLENGVHPWTTTTWQRDLFPREYRNDFLVLHPGVDGRRFTPHGRRSGVPPLGTEAGSKTSTRPLLLSPPKRRDAASTDDPSAFRQLGEAGQRLIEEKYSLAIAIPELKDNFERVASQPTLERIS